MHEYKVSLSERGQVVIPAEIRKKFKTRDFVISFSEGKIVMFPTKVEDKMKAMVSRIKAMNKKYARFSREDIDVLDEIKKEGA